MLRTARSPAGLDASSRDEDSDAAGWDEGTEAARTGYVQLKRAKLADASGEGASADAQVQARLLREAKRLTMEVGALQTANGERDVTGEGLLDLIGEGNGDVVAVLAKVGEEGRP